MNNPPQIEINLKNFRAIKEANIILDGITVVSGENGSGKSTLSKFFNDFFNIANSFEKALDNHHNKTLKDYVLVINSVNIIIGNIASNLELDLPEKLDFTENKKKRVFLRIEHQFVSSTLKTISEKIEQIDLLNNFITIHYDIIKNEPEYIRFTNILQDAISELSNDVFKTLKIFKNNLLQIKYKYLEDVKNRPLNFLFDLMNNIYNKSNFTFNILEFGSDISDKKNNILHHIYSINNSIYIDTPMAFNVFPRGKNKHWNNLNRLLKSKNEKNEKNFKYYFENTINGSVNYENNDLSKKFIYKRSDGKEFDLQECATGLKAFSIINLLYKNGHLDSKTLLIIDEPEAHLHPQWIVEYARLIVFLNKELGVKFFIASHNPDMISAIKYISKKEKTSKKLHFYLAKRQKDLTYKYKHLKTNIEPIFEEFNIAFDRMDKYGDTK